MISQFVYFFLWSITAVRNPNYHSAGPADAILWKTSYIYSTTTGAIARAKSNVSWIQHSPRTPRHFQNFRTKSNLLTDSWRPTGQYLVYRSWCTNVPRYAGPYTLIPWPRAKYFPARSLIQKSSFPDTDCNFRPRCFGILFSKKEIVVVKRTSV